MHFAFICFLEKFLFFHCCSFQLSRPPLFFRETNPQPRKHTLWQATSDFTGGQASMYRVHFIQCPQGMMNKHMEKLVHCDPRLQSLSQQNDFALDNLYFEKCSIFEDTEDIKCQKFEHKNDDNQLAPQSSNALLSPQSSASRMDAEVRQQSGTSDVLPGPYPSSVGSAHLIKQDGTSVEGEPHASIFNWNGFRVPGIRRSMSKSDIANHIGYHMYKQMYSGNLPANDAGIGSLGNGNCSNSKVSFDELTRQLLNDTQISDSADERMLMSRVNSLCCLIQRDTGSGQAAPGVCGTDEIYEWKSQTNVPQVRGDGSNGLLPPRQESFSDLVTNLPRISSFPHFL
jgi:hypothetical protein